MCAGPEGPSFPFGSSWLVYLKLIAILYIAMWAGWLTDWQKDGQGLIKLDEERKNIQQQRNRQIV
jgi:hypothetical protein